MNQAPLTLLNRRTRILFLSSGTAAFGLAATLAIFVISAGLGSVRTIVLEAQSTGVEIIFAGQTNDWALTDVTVCVPRAAIDRTLPRGRGRCDARGYTEAESPSVRINWNENASVVVTSPTPDVVVLDVTGQARIADRTRIILNRESWLNAGALTFNGWARLGEQLASGERKMILSGSYDIREKPFWSENTEVLKRGVIWRGESATIVTRAENAPKPAEVFGHITPVEAGKPGFAVGVVSAPGQVFLQIGFFGAAKPTQIAPSWIDRALTSPLILALAALLSVMLSLAQLLGNAATALYRFAREGSAPRATSPSSDDKSVAADGAMQGRDTSEPSSTG